MKNIINHLSNAAETAIIVKLVLVWNLFIVGLTVYLVVNYSLWWLLLLFQLITYDYIQIQTW